MLVNYKSPSEIAPEYRDAVNLIRRMPAHAQNAIREALSQYVASFRGIGGYGQRQAAHDLFQAMMSGVDP